MSNAQALFFFAAVVVCAVAAGFCLSMVAVAD
jgi:hypothetical protein